MCQASYVILLPAVQADEAVSQAGHKVLVVVPWPEHEVAIDSENPKGVQKSHLLSYCLVRSAELVKDGPVQTVVDGVEGETLGAPLRLEETRGKTKQPQEVKGKVSVSCCSFICHCCTALLSVWIQLL